MGKHRSDKPRYQVAFGRAFRFATVGNLDHAIDRGIVTTPGGIAILILYKILAQPARFLLCAFLIYFLGRCLVLNI